MMFRRPLVILLVWLAACAPPSSPEPAPPSATLHELYVRVEMERVFSDSKTFADAEPREAPRDILLAYRRDVPVDAPALRQFVDRYFDLPSESAPATPPGAMRAPIAQHIAALWPILTRPPTGPQGFSSLLPLNRPYVVPGGRFRELYYWDSYFTMLGLVRDGRQQSVRDMVDNFADLIVRYGHVPNGSRSYYLSRSQPPFFYLMVALTDADRARAFARYLPALRREHAFWMDGETRASTGHAWRRVARLPDGSVLNRYWDDRDTPRDESYREDVVLAASASRAAPQLYRDIRAAAESGWDFSSRWLADERSLETIETASISPVDLNSLLYGLEKAIGEGCAFAKDPVCAEAFEQRAERRRSAMNRYMWDRERGVFLDYHLVRGERLDRLSAATLYPLFVRAADAAQAERVARNVRAQLLAPGGLRTTTRQTGQQWDAPNGWAPLQWIAVEGLGAYGEGDLAREVANRFARTVRRAYCETGKLLEKYDIETARPGGGGEYPLQDGFGWTNGVTLALMQRYPDVREGCP
ncbi:MAG TPA: alpha,alpha-trehalase TreF [Caulobacterales bacterium]|nr:alpha,alpha-trehalase TreF [Caulobacterales bacterium]